MEFSQRDQTGPWSLSWISELHLRTREEPRARGRRSESAGTPAGDAAQRTGQPIWGRELVSEPAGG